VGFRVFARNDTQALIACGMYVQIGSDAKTSPVTDHAR